MATYVPGQNPRSPDRLDALVWAIHDLLGAAVAEPRLRRLT